MDHAQYPNGDTSGIFSGHEYGEGKKEGRAYFVGERIWDHASASDARSSPKGPQRNAGKITE
jgi:hypothetical protein